MTDISKCEGEGCDKREACYRFLAPTGDLQAFINPDPEECEYYWEIKNESK